jgi:hypothetical protein
VANGAAVTAYVSAPLCASAKQELASKGDRASDFRLRVVCLPSAYRGRQLDLATLGANARRATEDSASIAYLEQSGPVNRFSDPILESAGIAWLHASSGKTAMARLLHAVREASSGSLRQSVREALHKT